MFVCCECFVLSNELITRSEKSYRLWCVVVCDIETSWMRRPWPTGSCRTKNKQTPVMGRGSNPGRSKIFRTCRDGPWGPPSLLYNGYRSFPGVKRSGVTLTPQSLLVPWSRKSTAIPLLSLWVVRPVQSVSACTRVHFTFYLQQSLNPAEVLFAFNYNDKSHSSLWNKTVFCLFVYHLFCDFSAC